MSELRKANTDCTYFLTLTVAGWIDIFTRKRYNDVIIESLKFCVANKGLEIFEIFGYVIMPSHVHLVARSLKGNLNEILRDFKSSTAKAILEMIEKEEGESRKEWLLHMFKYCRHRPEACWILVTRHSRATDRGLRDGYT